MLKKFVGTPRIGKREKRQLKFLKPFSGGDWDSKDPRVKKFKGKMNIILRSIQGNCCAYCGLDLDETSAPELEHIAPKGGPKQPKHVELAFTPYNLCLACSLCNGFSKKGKNETINKKDINYKKCEFAIAHPHFDDPDEHFAWVVQDKKILIQQKSLKGKRSIELFELASDVMTEARTKKYVYEKMKQADLIKDVLAYFPS